jgi:Zn-finger nucleic acid-binding protein
LAQGVGDAPRVCPVCKIPVYEAEMGGLTALHCAECKGLGVTRETMMKMQPYGSKEVGIGPEERAYKRTPYFEPRSRPPFLICPVCRKRMKEAPLSGTRVDLCEDCGALWIEEARMAGFNDLIAPYKWKVSKEKR